MLRRIQIRNLAIVPEAIVNFEEGLNVLTGETGAGKSILVDAITLLAGGRASSDDVRKGEEMAVVEGILGLPSHSKIWSELSEMGVVRDGNEILLRRTISSDGRSRAYINDMATNVASLVRLAPFWLDLSTQHGQQELLDDESHTRLIDFFGGIVTEREKYSQQYEKVKNLNEKLQQLQLQKSEALRQQEFLEFQFRELSKVDAKLNEDEELKTRHKKLANSVQLVKTVQNIQEAFEGDGGVIDRTGSALGLLRQAAKIDPSVEAQIHELEELRSRFQDLSYQVGKYAKTLEFEPDELEKIDSRLAELQQLIRKYGSIENMISEKTRISSLLSSIESADHSQRELSDKLKTEIQILQESASHLAKKREEIARRFAIDVTKELRNLGLASAELKVNWRALSPSENRIPIDQGWYGPEGTKAAQLDFAPNPGEGFRSLGKIASGELSRILLAIKSVALSKASSDGITYLFDEIDSGIGGETAERVGMRMKVLSLERQVLCITHLAQIACYASYHFRVGKQVKVGRTFATVQLLKEKERTEELARMIGGIEISNKSLEHASELLSRGQKTSGGFDGSLRLR